MDSFQNYCIVCERLIPGPPEVEAEKVVKSSPKKKAAGSIRVKNPDGTTTTRNANGVKTTRLAPRRPGSTKSQTTKSDTDVIPSDSLTGPAGECPSAEKPVVQPIFSSTIYCSQSCCDQDHGSSNQTYEDIIRAFGIGHTDVVGVRSASAVGPPSPILGSDTDSSASISGLLAPLSSTPTTTSDTIFSDPASVPKGLGYFRMGRSQSDEWKELERKRRSSTNTNAVTSAHLNLQMSRQRSSASKSAVSATSSDSLSSLWQDQEVHRTMSLSGAVRSMVPVHSERHLSTSSEGGNVINARPIARSNYSQSSLAGMASPTGSSYVLPAQVGSAPSATAFLMHTYASAFPARDMTISPSLRATPIPGSVTPDIRSHAISPSSGTVRGSYTPSRSRAGSSAWDAYGKAAVREKQRRKYSNASDVGGTSTCETTPTFDVRRARGIENKDVTPTQSLEMENGGWQIRYGSQSGRRSSSTSRRRSDVPPSPALGSVTLPVPARATKPASVHGCAVSTSATRTCTPQSRLRRESRPVRPQSSTALPDLAALRIGASCAADTHVSTETATGRSVPRAGFDWGNSEHKTYELPKGVVVNPNKGLFYFKA